MFAFFSLLLLVQTVLAQFQVTTDQDTYNSGDTITVSWDIKSDTVLNLKDQDQAQLLLCTCNSTSKFGCKMADDQINVSDKKTSIPISKIADLGPDGSYAFQFVSKNSKNEAQYAIAYSSWIEIKGGMSGPDKANGNCQIPSDTDNNVPGTGSTIVWPSYTLPSEYKTVPSYMIPYTWQKGSVRMASAQPTPGTKVTQTVTPTRRYPTSSYTPFTTYFKNKYMPITTKTPVPTTFFQSENMVKSLLTTPSGRRATRVLPTLSLPTQSESASGGHKGRRRRWAD